MFFSKASRCLGRAICLVASVWVTAGASAAWPDKPIILVVPYSPGGPTDKTARDLAEALKKTTNAPAVIVENIAGAGGTIGAARVVKASPDGYTLLFTHTGLSTAPTLYPKLPFGNISDLEHLGVISEVPLVLVGRPSLKATNFGELLAWMKTQDQVTIGDAGVGSTSYLCAVLLQSELNVRLLNVPYKGIGPAMSDLAGGHIDLICDQTISSGPLVEGGSIKGFAVTTPQRLTRPMSLSALPTLQESGVKDFKITIWQALYAPKGTPKVVLESLNKALRAALNDPEFVQRQESLGAQIVSDGRLDPAGHKRFMEAEMARWAAVIKATSTRVN